MSSTHLITKSLENDRAGVRVIQMQCGETVRRAQMTCDDWEYFAEKNKKNSEKAKWQNHLRLSHSKSMNYSTLRGREKAF